MQTVSYQVDPEDILDQLDNEDIINHVGLGNILDEIGLRSCVNHFTVEGILGYLDSDHIRNFAKEKLGMIDHD